jgi:hypothetical protein
VAGLGLIPDIRPEIFESLKTIAIAMDATREDRRNTTQVLLTKLEILISNHNPFNTPSLVYTIEEMILSALFCGTIMERKALKSLMGNSVANARRHRARTSQLIDEAIKSAIFAKFGRFPKSLTSNAISTKIKREVASLLKEKNIRSLDTSAITKRVQKMRRDG